MRINEIAPNFTADTTLGKIDFHDWTKGNWTVFFSHPKDFTPVCTTEIGSFAKYEVEFKKRDCKLIGLSVDSIDSHINWLKDVEEIQGKKVEFPIIADENLVVSKLYDMLPASTEPEIGRTPQQNATVRSVLIIDPELRIKMILIYPMTTGRNIDELIRVLDSIQLTSKYKVATPVNWKNGEKVIIASSVSDTEAKKLFNNDWETVKPYLRIVDQPKN
jgi:alkyl hydroperoxide reductase subunit AhpC